MLENQTLQRYHCLVQWFTHNFVNITRDMIDVKFQMLPHEYVNDTFLENEHNTNFYTHEDLLDILDYLTHEVAMDDDGTFEELDFYNEEEARQYDGATAKQLMLSVVEQLQQLGDNAFFIVRKEAGDQLKQFANDHHVKLGDFVQPFINDDDHDELYLAMLPSALIDMLFRIVNQSEFDYQQVVIQFDMALFESEYDDVIKYEDVNFYKFMEENLKELAKA